MSDRARCEICMSAAKTLPSLGFDGIHQQCEGCGEFKLTKTSRSLLQGLDAVVRAKIAG